QSFTSVSNDNAVLYSGTISPGCLGVNTTGVIAGKTLTNSTSINVCLATGFSYTSGTPVNWGSAFVNNNCTGCNIVLPLNVISLTAVEQSNDIALQWDIRGNINGNEVFDIEESNDGKEFHNIAVIDAEQNISHYSVYDNNISAAQQFYRVKQISQNGLISYSEIISIKTLVGQQIWVYPNPVTNNNNLNIVINSSKTGSLELSLFDLSGKMLNSSNHSLQNGRNQLNFGLNNILEGTYILKFHSDYIGDSYSKIIVLR
ncbi:MAG TPA: T9SS type A sorting domain-containing protein, partial [Puia sp.]|nr:T9SS type A sorting domain-containing protein [Puia sp.]